MDAALRKVLVLDAMGVLYQACDDVKQLLTPFVESFNADVPADKIKRLYIEASLGRITSEGFWRAVGVPPEKEDEYLSLHKCSQGLFEFLDGIRPHVDDIACLSNDVSEWSVKLRKRFGLERYISEWFISGDLGVRKPDPGIYAKVYNYFQDGETSFFFFDDKPENVVAAERFGWDAYVFNQNCRREDKKGSPNIVDGFTDILAFAQFKP